MSPPPFSPCKPTKTTTKPRHFAVAPVKVQDVRRLVDIEFHAFENEQVNQVLSYRDYKRPVHFERSVKSYNETLLGEHVAGGEVPWSKASESESSPLNPLPFSRSSLRKIVDVETGEVVSFAKLEMKAYSPEELSEPFDVGHEGEPKMNRDWFGLNERLKREYVGQAQHCYIGMLATEPKHQHNGAGTMLLRAILAEADDLGIQVYLEATDTAKAFYQKHGFETITDLRFNPSDYGVHGLGTEHQTVMVRAARGNGVV